MDRVRTALKQASQLLQEQHILHALVGRCAIVAWKELADPGRVESMTEPMFLMRPEDLQIASENLEAANYRIHQLDSATWIVHNESRLSEESIGIVWTAHAGLDAKNEIDLSNSFMLDHIRVLSIDGLLKYHLNEIDPMNRTWIRELIEFGLVDPSWLDRIAPELAGKLSEVFAEP